MTDPAGVPALQDAIRHLHGCESRHVETVHVHEKHEGSRTLLVFMTERPYSPSDFEATVLLWRRTWERTFPMLKHPWAPEDWKRALQRRLAEGASVWVAEVKGQIIGFLVVLIEAGRLDQLWVDHDFHNGGIGSALLAKAKDLSPTGLRLETLEQNMGARGFYERRGFRPGTMSVNPINGQPNVEYIWPGR